MPTFRWPRDAYDHQSQSSGAIGKRRKLMSARRFPESDQRLDSACAGRPLYHGPEVGTLPGVCSGGCAMEVHQRAG